MEKAKVYTERYIEWRKRKSETCEGKLRRMCKTIAQEITEGEDADVGQWMEGVYDIEWITYQD